MDNKDNSKFNNEELNFLNERSRLEEEANASLEGRIKIIEAHKKLYKLIAIEKENLKGLEEEIRILKLELINGSEEEKKIAEEQLIIKEKLLGTSKEIIKAGEKQLYIQEAALERTNALKAAWSDTKKVIIQLSKKLVDQTGYLLDQQKAVKETELSMGVLSSQAGAFRNNIYETSVSTSLIGVSTKDLAKIQGTYSETIGRSVILSKEQLEAVSEIAAGTTLGVEGAAEFAANMDDFGISAKGSRDLVESMLKSSHKMGVNASKVIKTVQKNMKMAQRYHFKGGIEGLAKMAALTTKFKIEMESIAGFADKLMTPEGAVDAAAKLNVLGGEWAKLGDPFELMFRSRNDLEGLTKDIIAAATGTARLDEATGEIKIDPMELHRLREVANVTGISADELARMAMESAKFDAIKGKIRGSNFSDEDKEYVASLAQFDKDSGKFMITFKDDSGKYVEKAVDDLSSMNHETIKRIKAEEKTLEERALQAQTFSDTWTNLMNTFKSALLPAFQIIADKLQGWMEDLKPTIKWLTDTMLEKPLWVVGLGVAAAAITLLGNKALWLLKGRWLGLGFNKTAMAGKGGGGRNGKGGGFSGKPRKLGKPPIAKSTGKADKRYGKRTSGTKGSKMGKMGKGVGRGMGVMAGVGAAMDGYQNFTDESLTGWEAALKTLDENKFLALGAILAPFTGGASLGLGMLDMVAPTIGKYGEENDFISRPNKKTESINGTTPFGGKKHNDFIYRPGQKPMSFTEKDTIVGAEDGGPIDKMLANSSKSLTENREVVANPTNEHAFGVNKEVIAKPNKQHPFGVNNMVNETKKDNSRDKILDIIARPGENPISFTGNDTLSEGKKDTVSDKMLPSSARKGMGNEKLAVEFSKPLAIEGKFELISGNSKVSIDLDDPILMRKLSRQIQIELSSAIEGGKISSNPVNPN